MIAKSLKNLSLIFSMTGWQTPSASVGYLWFSN